MKPAKKFIVGRAYTTQWDNDIWVPCLCVAEENEEFYAMFVLTGHEFIDSVSDRDSEFINQHEREFYRIRKSDWDTFSFEEQKPGVVYYQQENMTKGRFSFKAMSNSAGTQTWVLPYAPGYTYTWNYTDMHGKQLTATSSSLVPQYNGVMTQPTCDCGAHKANTTHAGWCSVNGGK